jgi:hypothetical protein
MGSSSLIPIVKARLVSLAPERLSHFVSGLVERQANVGDHVWSQIQQTPKLPTTMPAGAPNTRNPDGSLMPYFL